MRRQGLVYAAISEVKARQDVSRRSISGMSCQDSAWLAVSRQALACRIRQRLPLLPSTCTDSSCRHPSGYNGETEGPHADTEGPTGYNGETGGPHAESEHGVLCPLGDGAHDVHSLEGELAVGGLPREHDCVRALPHRNGNVRHLRTQSDCREHSCNGVMPSRPVSALSCPHGGTQHLLRATVAAL